MSYSCTIHFKNIPPEKVYSFLQEYKSEVKKRADIICEKNFLWMPSIRNSHIYKDVEEHIVNDIDINWVRGSLLTHRFFYLPEHQLLGIFGVPDGFKDMFDNISHFQDSCDQDYEFEDWKGVPLFEKISNKWENASEDDVLKSSKNSSERLLYFNGETVIEENGKLIFESQELSVPYNNKASYYTNAFICPNCGAKLSYQNNFCHKCGKKVKLECLTKEMFKEALEKDIIKTISAEAGYLAIIGDSLFKIDDFEKSQSETLDILFGILEGYKVSGDVYEKDYIDCFKYIKNNGKVEK